MRDLVHMWITATQVHWFFNAPEELPGPGDRACHWGNIARDRRSVLVLVKNVLDFDQVPSIVVKDEGVFAFQLIAQAIASQNHFELLEQSYSFLSILQYDFQEF